MHAPDTPSANPNIQSSTSPMSEFCFDFKDVVEEAGDIIVITKAFPYSFPGPEIVYVNQAFTDLTGYSFDEAVGKNPRMLQRGDVNPETKSIIREALKKQESTRVTIRNYSKEGVGYWLEMSILPLKDKNGDVTHFAAIERDVTESKERELELHEMSRRDALSGLLNRRAFDQILDDAYLKYRDIGEEFSVLALDIDHFKQVNDQYGHHYGDRVICKVAEVCKKVFSTTGSVGRTGGEEFSILVPGKGESEASLMAEHLRRNIEAATVFTEKGAIKITTSVGVSQIQPADLKPLKIMIRADAALYSAKHNGRNQVCKFDAKLLGAEV